jgi:UDP-3-O-[3-hydroxymyristoyl] glucosamine N-acyltransferase
MNITVKNIANIVDGEIIGDPNLIIKNVARIEEANEGDLTFLYNSNYKKHLASTKATAILIDSNTELSNHNITYIKVVKPNIAFQEIIIKFFNPDFKFSSIAKSANIDVTATLAENVGIGENVFIGKNCIIQEGVTIYPNTVILDNCKIGTNTLIFPNVTIREDTIIGKNVIIQPGAVIGSDGFGYSKDSNGIYNKIPQIGNVIIEDDVEIGANVTIDRSSLGSTIIGKGVKLDNLVQVAHNVTIGSNTVFSSQSGIAGSAKIGNNCIVAGQVGIVGHLEVGDDIIIGGQSGVTKSLKKPGTYFGTPAKEIKTSLRLESHIRNLPNYAEKIKNLENKITDLESKLFNNKEKGNN